MVKDLAFDQSKGKKIIEALISDPFNPNIKVWIPVMATNLYLINKDQEIVKVEEIHVRDFMGEMKATGVCPAGLCNGGVGCVHG